LSDRLAQVIGSWFPNHLPERMEDYRARYEHHLMLKVCGAGVEEARRYLAHALDDDDAAAFECSDDESAKAFLHRFAAAGAAVRFRAIHHQHVSDIVALDIALRRNDRDWMETLPNDLAAPILHRMYYGHFLCHVFHQDYIVAKGQDPHALEQRMLAFQAQRGAKYPAEHNVGHLYEAGTHQKAHFKALDPCN